MIRKTNAAETARRWPRVVPPVPAETCQGCALRGARLCNAIRETNSPGTCRPVIRRFDRGALIPGQNEWPGLLGVIRRGYTRQSTMRLSGNRILLDLAVPGDIVGQLLDEANGCDVEAATDVEVCLFDGALARRQFWHGTRFRQLVFDEMEDRHRRLLRNVWRAGTLSSQERIIAFLVSALEFMPTEPLPDGSIVLNMEIDRRDWADLTNTTVETISRTLHYLDDKDLVARLTPSRFQIRDVDRLAALAGVERPARRLDGQELRAGVTHRYEAPKSIGRMTAVNAPGMRTHKLHLVLKPVTAPTRDPN